MLASWAFLTTGLGVLKIIWKVLWHLVVAHTTFRQDLRNKFYREEGHLVTLGGP